MAAGAFPVVADLPALREWIEPPNGLLAAAEPAAVAAALVEGLRSAATAAHVEPNRAAVMARAERSTNLLRYERLLSDAAATPRPGR
jgi:hypothetical protein